MSTNASAGIECTGNDDAPNAELTDFADTRDGCWCAGEGLPCFEHFRAGQDE